MKIKGNSVDHEGVLLVDHEGVRDPAVRLGSARTWSGARWRPRGAVSGRVCVPWMHQNGRGIDLATFIFQLKNMIFGDFQKILENPWIWAHPG